jgi:hypothetical protein
MRPIECEFESEVLSAVLQSRWPARVEADLRAHAEACEICRDVIAVAGVIDQAHDEIRAQAVVPNSGRVWWLAQMRARREAAAAAGRPITVAQMIAFACAVGLLGACFGASSTWFQSALGRMASSISGFRIQPLVPFVVGLVAGHSALVIAMAAMLIVLPAAVCLAMFRD